MERTIILNLPKKLKNLKKTTNIFYNDLLNGLELVSLNKDKELKLRIRKSFYIK